MRTVCAAVLNNGTVRATVKDVAARAGVSPKTVSNVIHGVVFVRPETRERVERALAELDYVPNLGARGLRNGRYGLIALALPDLSTAYSAELAHHFVEEAHARGWSVQIEETAAEPGRERDLLSRARSHLVDGLVLNPVSLADSVVPVVRGTAAADGAHRRGRPGPGRPRGRGQRAGLAGRDGAPAGDGPATHRRGGHAAGGRGDRGGPAAHRGVPVGARGGGGGARPGPRDPGAALDDASRRSRRPAPTWRGTPVPDAFVCFTDSMALGVLSVLWERGLRVPDDVAVAGFDDVAAARYAVPPLTTVAFDLRGLRGGRAGPAHASASPTPIGRRGSSCTPTGSSSAPAPADVAAGQSGCDTA